VNINAGVDWMSINSNVDILKKIAEIERLKCGLLSSVSAFFEDSLNGGHVADSMCDVLQNCYLLAAQQGVSFESLNKRTAERLRVGILENDVNEADRTKQELVRHLEGRY